jgi:dTDP-4-amino-4,6-dideoxygalactose transaminase
VSITLAPAIPFLDLGAVHRQLRHELDGAWANALDSSAFIGGPSVERFEAEFAAFCAARFCIGVANGTDALELILAGLGIGPGDEVIVPAATFVATIEAVVAVGARPRFADVDPSTMLLTVETVEPHLGPRTAAILPVHLYGQMVDVDALGALADRHGLALIEDAAQAHGARHNGRRAGSAGRAAAFSFYPGKNLGALGDGGAVVTDDAELVARIRVLADHGRRIGTKHQHDVSGRNSRLDALQAEILSTKLAHLDRHNASRREAMAWYGELLPAWSRLVSTQPGAEAVHHLTVIRPPDRDVVTAALDAAAIGWGLHYPVACHRQPAFARFADGPLAVAEDWAATVVSLPMFPGITLDQVARVAATLRSVEHEVRYAG